MSWSELERLVETAELDASLRRALRHCRSVRELLMAARRLGFAVVLNDLQEARRIDRGQREAAATVQHTLAS